MNLLKLAALALVAFALFGCASSKKDFKFVPMNISWQAVNGLDTDDPNVSTCQVKMTTTLTSQKEIQKLDFVAYEVAISGTAAEGGTMLSFVGACSEDAGSVPEELCSWTAKCTPEGEIQDFVMGAAKAQ